MKIHYFQSAFIILLLEMELFFLIELVFSVIQK